LVVELQALIFQPKREWVFFGDAITGRCGDFHARYHFQRTYFSYTYRLRARLRSQLGYSGPAIHSLARQVHVIG
jgi:hypothetical protein